MDPVIEGTQVALRRERADLLRRVDLVVPRAKRVALLGPNGCGKTSLIKCLLGLWTTSSGQIRIQGRPQSEFGPRELAARLAHMPQDHAAVFAYTARELVLMGRAPCLGLFGVPTLIDEHAALEALDRVGAGQLADRPYAFLSGGERQLVLLARCLVRKPVALLLDEPTSHLDLCHQTRIFDLTARLVREEGLSILATLHDPNQALNFFDEVVLMADGTTLCQGRPSEVLTTENLERVYGVELERIEDVEGRPRALLWKGSRRTAKESRSIPLSVTRPQDPSPGRWIR